MSWIDRDGYQLFVEASSKLALHLIKKIKSRDIKIKNKGLMGPKYNLARVCDLKRIETMASTCLETFIFIYCLPKRYHYHLINSLCLDHINFALLIDCFFH